MRKFIKRALNKLPKLDKSQIHALLYDMASENERLEAVLESMAEGIIVTDKDHKLILINKPAERLLQFAGSDILEKPVWDAVEDPVIADFLNESLMNQAKVLDKEFTVDSGGNPRILALSILPLVYDGQIQGSLVHLNDITERKGKEARLRRAENLASLTTLAAGVAHEIKNPLGSLSIHIQLIQKSLKNKRKVNPKDIEQHLEVINEEISRLNSIVVDFLFAVRPMDTKMELHDLGKIVHEIVDFVHFELETSGVYVIENLCKDLPLIELDEKYIKQAILNLIKNAASAMPDGGNITISTRIDGAFIILDVTDTGIGIPDEIMDKIFEPYFTTKDFGSGLGLTVVYKIVKEHRGDISVNSKVGEGSTFSISFPIPVTEKHLLGYRGEEE
ncbi:MAG: ATP-binding protein [Spirochaetota bacterium]